MNHIQTDVSDEALVTAIRANMYDFFRYLSKRMPEKQFENGSFARGTRRLRIRGLAGSMCQCP